MYSMAANSNQLGKRRPERADERLRPDHNSGLDDRPVCGYAPLCLVRRMGVSDSGCTCLCHLHEMCSRPKAADKINYCGMVPVVGRDYDGLRIAFLDA